MSDPTPFYFPIEDAIAPELHFSDVDIIGGCVYVHDDERLTATLELIEGLEDAALKTVTDLMGRHPSPSHEEVLDACEKAALFRRLIRELKASKISPPVDHYSEEEYA